MGYTIYCNQERTKEDVTGIYKWSKELLNTFSPLFLLPRTPKDSIISHAQHDSNEKQVPSSTALGLRSLAVFGDGLWSAPKLLRPEEKAHGPAHSCAL